MEFSITDYEHCDLLEISGRIDSYTSPNVDQALKALIDDQHSNIVVDMQNVTYISSSGILVLVNAMKKLRNLNQGDLVFARVPKQILSSFELAGFNTLFDFYDDPISAIERFKSY